MSIQLLSIQFLIALCLISCNLLNNNDCGNDGCSVDYKISGEYTFQPSKETYQVGESIKLFIDVPYEIWDTTTSKFISLRDFPLRPIISLLEIDFETKRTRRPDPVAMQIDSFIRIHESILNSDKQPPFQLNNYDFSLAEEENGRNAELTFQFIRPGKYIVNSKFYTLFFNYQYRNTCRIKFDTTEDLCCCQRIHPKLLYTGENVKYKEWFTDGAIFIDDHTNSENDMLSEGMLSRLPFIIEVVE